jgi:hypothetical protein
VSPSRLSIAVCHTNDDIIETFKKSVLGLEHGLVAELLPREALDRDLLEKRL